MQMVEGAGSSTPSTSAEVDPALGARLGYQPALDGLRAIAVLAVLLYHHDHSIAGGGFFGVDVFFVLSGFLITGLLVAEHHREGGIDMVRFWGRRARRLLPALGLCLALVAVYAVTSAPAPEHAQLRGDALATAFYVENWRAAAQLVDHPSALGHTWSLSVEEQWYLLWPLVIAAVLGWRRRRGRVGTRPVAIAVAGVAVASAVTMAVLAGPSGSRRAFYGTDTRAQGLLVGAALALLIAGRPAIGARAARTLEVLGCLSVLALLGAFVVARTHQGALYRGGFLAVALLAAVVVLAAVQPRSPVLGRALAWRPLVAIGLVSYGLYLFHLPVYYWLTYQRTGLHGPALLGLRLMTTAAVAVVSYAFLEQPIRRRAFVDAGARWLVPVGCFTLALALLVAAVPGGGAETSIGREYRFYANSAPRGDTRVLVAGGPEVAALPLVEPVLREPGISAVTFGSLRCAAVAGDRVLGAAVVREWAGCRRRMAHLGAAVEGYDPAVAALVLGPEEADARQVGGVVLPAGSAALASHVESELARRVTALRRSGASVVVGVVGCAPPDHTDPRAAWLEDRVHRVAASNRISVVALTAQMCPRGVAPPGVLDAKGALTPAGLRALWEAVAASARRAAGDARVS